MPQPRERGLPLPGTTARPLFDLVWPRVAEPLDVTFLEDMWLGLPTHWLPAGGEGRSGRSVLCTASHPDGCGECGRRMIWQGYIAVASHTHRIRAVCVLSDQLARHLRSQVAWPGGLAGMRWRLKRSSPRPCAPVIAERVETGRAMTGYPAHDIMPTLAAVFGVALDYMRTFIQADLPGGADITE